MGVGGVCSLRQRDHRENEQPHSKSGQHFFFPRDTLDSRADQRHSVCVCWRVSAGNERSVTGWMLPISPAARPVSVDESVEQVLSRRRGAATNQKPRQPRPSFGRGRRGWLGVEGVCDSVCVCVGGARGCVPGPWRKLPQYAITKLKSTCKVCAQEGACLFPLRNVTKVIPLYTI